MSEVTALLKQAREGDAAALNGLFEAVYPELRRIAHGRLYRDDGGTHLNTTALVNECFLKFADAGRLTPVDRIHFLAYAATVMRSILVDAARARYAQRRGGGERALTLDSEIIDNSPSDEEQVIFVNDALAELAALDARLARVVEMRYFGGMDDEEIGQALGVTGRTVRRDWDKARMILAASLRR